MIRVVFHVEVELDHRDQIAPIMDDLSDRYGGTTVKIDHMVDDRPVSSYWKNPPEEDA